MMLKLLRQVTAVLMCWTFLIAIVRAQKFGESVLVHEWSLLDFDWPSDTEKQQAISNGTYIPERSVIAGIKVYKKEVYLSIPRWFWTSGHPVTLAKIIDVEGQVKIKPYPNWAAQKQGDCQALQFVWSMEIDPNTGFMYVIDTGRVGMQLNLCSAKIVVFDLNTDTQVGLYELPDDVVSETNNFLNDIVLDYVDGKVRYAYITEANDGYLVVYDFEARSAYKIDHESMKADVNNDSVINITGKLHKMPVPIDGIAVSPDFKYVYYCALGSYDLYQVPTSALRTKDSSFDSAVRLIGKKVSQSDGIAHGSRRLYYGALSLNAVYYWDLEHDMEDQQLPLDQVTLTTQVELARDEENMQWPDTFAFDNEGWLWFVSNRLHLVKNPKTFVVTSNPHMRVWKVYVNETGYLYEANIRTTKTGHSAQNDKEEL